MTTFSSGENHPSAVKFPEDVHAYFNKELTHKAIAGPFNDFQFPVHYSPMLTRPKTDDTRRVIVNLSYPYGHSVNDAISKDVHDTVQFNLKYPSIDHIVDAIGQSDTRVMLSKIDVNRAFCNLCVDPSDYNLLGIKWNNNSYLDINIPMGLKMGSALCQRTTDILRHILYNYIDVICVHRERDTESEFNMMYSSFEFLGIPINPQKVVCPTSSLTCMGIVVDVAIGQLYVPQEKCIQVLDLCRDYKSRLSISKRQLQSLLGKLLYLHRCVTPARIFVNRIFSDEPHLTSQLLMT